MPTHLPGVLLAVSLVLAQAPPGSTARDTLESAPAPLLVPGRVAVPDTSLTSRRRRALEQVELGLAFEREGGRAPAIAAYRNAVRLDSTVAEANYRTGMLFMEVGEFGEAARALSAEVAHHPQHLDAVRQLGIALVRSGEHGQALAQLELLTKRRPGDGASWHALGFAYAAAGRPRDAEMALRRAIRLLPRRAAAHRDLGALLAAAGRTEDARAAYRRAMALEPSDATVWINVANLELRLRRLPQALEAYRSAERKDSTLLLALQGQVRTLHEMGREAEAGAVYRRLLKARPDDLEARRDAVRLFDRLGRRDIALELARDGVRTSRGSGESRLLLAMALQASGETRAALLEMRRAESATRDPAGRDRARQLIAALRATAPDSLREVFDTDSVAHPVPPARRPTPVIPGTP